MSVISDVDIDWSGKPVFLIDAITRNGTSGSLVLAKRVSIYQTLQGSRLAMQRDFLTFILEEEYVRPGLKSVMLGSQDLFWMFYDTIRIRGTAYDETA